MMGCQPQGSLHSPSHSGGDPRYSQASHTQPQETVSLSRAVHTHTPQHHPSSPHHHHPHTSSSKSSHHPSTHTYPSIPHSEGEVHQQQLEGHRVSCVGSCHQPPTHALPAVSTSYREDEVQQQHQQLLEKCPGGFHHSPTHNYPSTTHLEGEAQQPEGRSLTSSDMVVTHRLAEVDEGQGPCLSGMSSSLLGGSDSTDCECGHVGDSTGRFSQRVETGMQQGLVPSFPQPGAGSSSLQLSPSSHQLSPGSSSLQLSPSHQLSPSATLQLSPGSTSHQLSPSSTHRSMGSMSMLQVGTSDHSPVSPASTTGSSCFIFPDVPSSSSSLAPAGAGDCPASPYLSPVKREVKVEMDVPIKQGQGDRQRRRSREADLSEALVDSETGSSMLEDSSSSREQSPFSAMAESLSLCSPSDHSPSATRKKTFFQHDEDSPSATRKKTLYQYPGCEGDSPSTVRKKTFYQYPGCEEEDREGAGPVPLQSESDLHPSKFKKRLHERYVLSLKDVPDAWPRIGDSSRSPGSDGQNESKRPISKVERPDSPQQRDSSMPKSPRRSSSDTDMVAGGGEGGEAGGSKGDAGETGGTSSADEGDVFMEPTLRARTKRKPPSLRQQREPLDLSRGPPYPAGFRSSSSSSPLVDADHLSPAAKMFSPVFRSPHRLPYSSPHGLLSPQSQSPLCPVPEGGRVFSFNVPSPLDGPHSDSDLVSPSPLSPRVFTFPPPGGAMTPMSEVNRLAVSPRAPYTPPPSFLLSKPGGGGAGEAKWGEPPPPLCSKRSLSESDVSYVCPVCGQVFPTSDNLAKHMTKHLPTEGGRLGGDSGKAHYCKVCSRSFSRSDMLTRHMRLHTGLKPYECLDCGQVFSRSDHLNTHRRTHTGEKPYRCPHCPYAACRRDMITRHMRTHAKRGSRRARYLSVPEDSDAPKPSGSISSTDSQDCSTGGATCSVSSVDSVESESLHLGASVDSLLSPDPDSLPAGTLTSPAPRKCWDELDDEGKTGGGSEYERFMHYRKARNWSTTSLESVDSEEALLIREALVDDAFQDSETPYPHGEVGGGVGPEEGGRLRQHPPSSTSSARDLVVGLEAKTLQKCFISPQPPGGS